MLSLGLVPSRLVVFGLEFNGATPQTVRWLLSVAAAYFLAGFVVSMARDLMAERAAAYRLEIQKQQDKFKGRLDGEPGAVASSSQIPYYESRLRDYRFRWLWLVRLAFECGVPVVLGVWAVFGR